MISHESHGFLITFLSLLLNLVIVWVVFRNSETVQRVITRSGAKAIAKVMALFGNFQRGVMFGERRGITVEKHQVLLDEPLKQLGTYKVQVKVAAHLIAEVTVTVEPKS
jgi:ribosomal protein L9